MCWSFRADSSIYRKFARFFLFPYSLLWNAVWYINKIFYEVLKLCCFPVIIEQHFQIHSQLNGQQNMYISGNNWGSCWGSDKMLKGCFASIHNENISITNFWGCFSHVRRTLTDYHKWDIKIMIWKLNVKVVLWQFHFCWWRSPSNFMNRRSVANLQILLRKMSYFGIKMGAACELMDLIL